MNKKELQSNVSNKKRNAVASDYLSDMVDFFYNTQMEFKETVDTADKKTDVRAFGTTSYIRYRAEIEGVETEITVYYNRFLDLYDVITNSTMGHHVFRVNASSSNLVEHINKKMFQTSAMKHLLATNIEDMELSTTAITILKTKGVRTLCDAVKIRLEDLSELCDEETSRKVYLEIQEMFDTFGIESK